MFIGKSTVGEVFHPLDATKRKCRSNIKPTIRYIPFFEPKNALKPFISIGIGIFVPL
jgi:hypothetical protein